MARYVIGTHAPTPGRCNDRLPSGRYCSQKLGPALKCSVPRHVPKPYVFDGKDARTPDGARLVDALPDITSDLQPLRERVLSYLDRLAAEASRLEETEEPGTVAGKFEGLMLASEHTLLLLADDEEDVVQGLAKYVELVKKDSDELKDALREDLGTLDELERYEGVTEGIKLALSYLDEECLIPEEIAGDTEGGVEGASETPGDATVATPSDRHASLDAEIASAHALLGEHAEIGRELLLSLAGSEWARGKIESHGKRHQVDPLTDEVEARCRCGGPWPCPMVKAYEAFGLPIPESVYRDHIPNPSPELKVTVIREMLRIASLGEEAKVRLGSEGLEDYRSRFASVFGAGAHEALLGLPRLAGVQRKLLRTWAENGEEFLLVDELDQALGR